jgi:hypothetical protein
MKKIFTLLFLYFVSSGLIAQQSSSHGYLADKDEGAHNKKVDFTGQWKGGFNENNGISGFDDLTTRYVLELTIDGSNVSGYSYTYFQEMNKKYFTICRLIGSLNRSTNEVVVTEIERVKYNTPPDFGNCFQTHRLHYEKGEDNTEILTGTWIPAPNQPPTCGRGGTTTLSRRIVSDMPTGFMPHKTLVPVAPKENKPKQQNPVATAAPQKHEATKKPQTNAEQPTPELGNIAKAATIQPDIPLNDNPESTTLNKTAAPVYKEYEARRKDVVQTIELEQPTFHLDFYDNGEIDGDSITVFYNGKMVLAHKRLSDKPISLDLTLDKDAKENIVTMYADNLGTIPPNTALMIVTDGGKRYEVRMESDYGKSGSVIFKSVK